MQLTRSSSRLYQPLTCYDAERRGCLGDSFEARVAQFRSIESIGPIDGGSTAAIPQSTSLVQSLALPKAADMPTLPSLPAVSEVESLADSLSESLIDIEIPMDLVQGVPATTTTGPAEMARQALPSTAPQLSARGSDTGLVQPTQPARVRLPSRCAASEWQSPNCFDNCGSSTPRRQDSGVGANVEVDECYRADFLSESIGES
ncbi:MAG: hypothetical protein R3C56_36490 [Pirellulaceae bacterium]